MKRIFKEIYASILFTIESLIDLFNEATWDFRQLPYSYEHHKLMSHPIDRHVYLSAANKLVNGESEEELVTLHDGRSFTIRMN